MKRTKRVMALLMMCLLVFGSVVPAQAAIKTRTKSVAGLALTLKYDAYKDSAGRKLVRNGTITKVTTGSALSNYIGSHKLSRIDGGRTYLASTSGTVTGLGGSSWRVAGSVEFTYDS